MTEAVSYWKTAFLLSMNTFLRCVADTLSKVWKYSTAKTLEQKHNVLVIKYMPKALCYGTIMKYRLIRINMNY